VVFLGYKVSPGEIRIERAKIKAIQDWPTPTSVTEVRGFTGFVNFYRMFVKKYGDIARPLTDLTKKDVDFQWGQVQEQAFQQVKDLIVSDPVLKLPDPQKEYEVEADASDYACGGQLGQRDENGKLHPVAFFSKKFTKEQLGYPIHDKELLAIVTAFEEWRPYLSGTSYEVKVWTDHKNLQYFTTTKKLNGRLTRWYEFLSEFWFRIRHIKGTENARADALSRRPDHFEKFDNTSPPLFQLQEDGSLGHAPQQDTECGAAFREQRPSSQHPQEITDLETQEGIIRGIHESKLGGHMGITKTAAQVKARGYIFPALRKRVKEVVKKCDICNKIRAARHKPYGLLQPLPVAEQPWSSVTMDFITKLPLSKDPTTGTKYDSILTVVDRLTKWSYFFPYKETWSAEQLADVVFRHIASVHGWPKEWITDRDTKFASKF
jgi:hypothetical protein